MRTSRVFVMSLITLGICVPMIVHFIYRNDDAYMRWFARNAGKIVRFEQNGHTQHEEKGTVETTKTTKLVTTTKSLSEYRDIRVLCWIMTAPEFLWTRAVHVRNTWGQNCTVLLFASDYKDDNFTTINITVPHGRDYLPMKTFKALDYVFRTHLNDSEWFFKADDDTFAYMDNMRKFLRNFDTDKPIFFGYFWKKYAKQGYPSGGAGYILSKEALRRFGNRPAGKCSSANGDEDVKMGLCMEKLGVKALSSELLHPFAPINYSNIQRGTITLHYVPHKEMYKLQKRGSPH